MLPGFGQEQAYGFSVGTGLIVAFVVTVWAAYFVPLALRRYDEAHEQSALETLSPLSRVIRRSPDPDQLRDEASHVEVAPVESERAGRSRSAARLAARRRRRVLVTLVFANAIVAGLAGPGYAVIPLWSIAIPLGFLVAWLVACRVQVRHEYGIAAPRARVSHAAPKVAKRLKVSKHGSAAAQGEDTVEVFLGANAEDVDPTRRHVMEDAELEADALEEHLVIAVPSAASHGEMVWDPLPVTLPTYVTKPRAGRTVRTIDFDAPGAWTSGHVEGEEVELPASEASSGGTAADAQRHASGQ
jgi:hypothetical protein